MTNKPKNERVNVVDALRGFAVMAIMLLHFIEHFIYGVYPENSPEALATLNQNLFDSLFFVFAGKSYTIFALLFGFTFMIQQRNQELRGSDFGLRFAWRLLLLMLFATLNSLFFPGGDVLLLFAIMGFVMIPLRKLSERKLLIIASIFLIQPIELLECIGINLIPTVLNDSYYPLLTETVTNGTLWDMIATNATTGQIASLLWAVDAGRLLQAPGLFIIGMVLSQGGYFLRGVEYWGKILTVGIIASFILFIAKSSTVDSANIILTMWYNLAFTAIIVSIFVILYQTEFFKKITCNLNFYGRMSLTNYISQSFIGSLIFFPYALGLADTLGVTLSFIVGIALFALQLQFCKWWLKGHKQGPLEHIWHKLTWLK
ncbi:MAG: DUF418 domain-containing protein [Rikenellaceae bacterium]